MKKHEIEALILAKQKKKYRLRVLLDDIGFLELSELAMSEIRTNISSKIAQCNISICHYEKLLNKAGDGQ